MFHRTPDRSIVDTTCLTNGLLLDLIFVVGVCRGGAVRGRV